VTAPYASHRVPRIGQPSVPWFLRSRWRLSLALLVALAVPMAVLTTAVVVNARQTLETQAFQQNTVAARLGAQAVESHFEGLARYIESAARRREVRDALIADDLAAMRAELRVLVESNEHFDRAFLATPEGIECGDWPADPSVIGKSFAFRDWYIGVSRAQDTYASEAYLRAGAPRVDVVAVSTPVRAEDGRTAGYLVAQYPLASLTRRLATIRPGESGSVTLIDHHGHAVVGREDAATEAPDMSDDPLVRQALAGKEVSAIDNTGPLGELRLRSLAPVPGIGWAVSAEQPGETVYAPAVQLQRAIVALSMLCLAGMLALGFVSLEVVRRQHFALIELQALKDQLSSMIIHDLRNPLTAAILSIDLAGEGFAGNAVARRDLDNAALSARRMRALIDSLIDVIKLEAGAMELNLASVDLVALVRDKVVEYGSLAGAGLLKLEAVVPVSSLLARVDPDLLGRVLDNLITNAIKHTPAGGRVEVRLAPSHAGAPITLCVSDTGEGISPEDQSRLFQKFERASGQIMSRPRDAGLGLVFCRMAVELHGGRISVESAPGTGSTFRVELPAT